MNKIRIGLMIAGALLIGWQFQRHRRLSRELALLQTQLQSKDQEFETRRAALEELEQKDRDSVESERRAGNETLIALMRERNSATRFSDATAEEHSLGNALASGLESPDLRDVEHDTMRAEMRANMGLFFKLTHLTPEEIDRYIDLSVDMENRKARRISALLRGTVPVADALADRDRDRQEQEERSRAVLGTNNYAFLQSIADGMRNDEAKRLLGIIQANMGGNSLNAEQGDQLRSLLKDQIVTMPLDEIDLFRPTEEWTQVMRERQEKVLQSAAAFLSPAQLKTLQTLSELELAQRQADLVRKRKSLGIR